MSKKEVYFLDTINSTKNYDNIIGTIDLNYYHSYNVSYPLKYSLKNLKSITLKSVEMPIALPNIRLHNSSHKIGLTFTYSTYTNVSISFNLSPNTYTNTSLLTAINNQLTGVLGSTYPGLSISFTSLSSLFGNYCSINNNCTSLTIDNTVMTNYILGFTNNRTSTSSNPLQATAPINVNAIDTCIYINITNIPVTNNNNSQPFTFKIPLSNIITNGTLYFNDSAEHQTIYFYDNSFVLDRLNIVVYDRLGFPLTGYMNWTMTLLLDYHNPKEQEFLNLQY